MPGAVLRRAAASGSSHAERDDPARDEPCRESRHGGDLLQPCEIEDGDPRAQALVVEEALDHLRADCAEEHHRAVAGEAFAEEEPGAELYVADLVAPTQGQARRRLL